MTPLNTKNELIKRRHAEHLVDVLGRSPRTADHALTAITKFEEFTDRRPFSGFRNLDAKNFKAKLLEGNGRRAASRSGRSAAHTTLNHVEQFFRWLASQPGYKKALAGREIGYFNLSNEDRRIATARMEKASPTLEQVRQVILSMPVTNDVELRNQAVIAGALLTGARIAALASFKIGHVRRDRLGVNQIGGEVRTKYAKTFTTLFYPVGSDIKEIFLAYVDHLRGKLGRTDDDPLFPSTRLIAPGSRHFGCKELTNTAWESVDPVRAIFKAAFAQAGLPYFTPHTIRSTIAKFGASLARTAEEMKAWSEGLGHEQASTTLSYYAALTTTERAVVMERLAKRCENTDNDEHLLGDLASRIEKLLANKK